MFHIERVSLDGFCSGWKRANGWIAEGLGVVWLIALCPLGDARTGVAKMVDLACNHTPFSSVTARCQGFNGVLVGHVAGWGVVLGLGSCGSDSMGHASSRSQLCPGSRPHSHHCKILALEQLPA